jgi:hypothetical protein
LLSAASEIIGKEINKNTKKALNRITFLIEKQSRSRLVENKKEFSTMIT